VKIAGRLVALGDELGEEIHGRPRGIELLKKFVNSMELPADARLWARTSLGEAMATPPPDLRAVLRYRVPIVFAGRGCIDVRESVLALLQWRQARADGYAVRR
jgi:hypothetical protein